ncbi:MAG: hypothetical protein AAF637_23665 [Pseudomonadota bacterium]
MTDPAKLHEIIELLGDIEATKAEAILATGASMAEIEQAQAWVAGEGDALGEAERSLSGRVAEVFDILDSEGPLDDRD